MILLRLGFPARYLVECCHTRDSTKFRHMKDNTVRLFSLKFVVLVYVLLTIIGSHVGESYVFSAVNNRQHLTAMRTRRQPSHVPNQRSHVRSTRTIYQTRGSWKYHGSSTYFDEEEIAVASQYKIITCSATSCAKQRQKQSLNEYATFSAFWQRLDMVGLLHIVDMEETSCLGSCTKSPCIAVEHEEYEGTVALLGMTPCEFEDRVFHNVLNDADVDRVWEIIENSIRFTAAAGNSEVVADDDDCDYDISNNPNAV
jgi:NADH:ubiquinone oxidoreductase subunit E